MHVSCIIIVPKIWVGSPIHLNKSIVQPHSHQRDGIKMGQA
jgi:hypothetical protein